MTSHTDLSFPTARGSLIRATSTDDHHPRNYFLSSDYEDEPRWVSDDDIENTYSDRELSIIAVIHDAATPAAATAMPEVKS